MKKILVMILALMLSCGNFSTAQADELQDRLKDIHKQFQNVTPTLEKMQAVQIVDQGGENFLERILQTAGSTSVEFTDLEYFPEYDINGGFLTTWVSAYARENPYDDSEYMENPEGIVSLFVNGDGYVSMISVAEMQTARDRQIYFETINIILNTLGLNELEKIELLSSPGSVKSVFCQNAGRRIHFSAYDNSIMILATEY